MPSDPKSCSNTGTLSPFCIGLAILGAGWRDANMESFLDTAIAVALAESGGNTGATNKNQNGSSDYGLWQINSIHASRFKNYHGMLLWDSRMEAAANTAMARELWKDNHSFSPWTGTYGAPPGSAGRKRFEANRGHGAKVWADIKANKLHTEVGGIPGPPIPGDKIAGLVAPGLAIGKAGLDKAKDPIGKAVDKVLGFLKEGAVTAGVFILGVILIILGIWWFLSQTKAGKIAIGAAETAATGGASSVAKSAKTASSRVGKVSGNLETFGK